jgi:hypothetical protein
MNRSYCMCPLKASLDKKNIFLDKIKEKLNTLVNYWYGKIKGAFRNKLSRSIWIKRNKFIDELLDVCLTCGTHYSKTRAPLHSMGGPAPLLIISVGWWERLVSSIALSAQEYDRRTIYLMSSLSQGMTVRQASGPPQYMRYESSAYGPLPGR